MFLVYIKFFIKFCRKRERKRSNSFLWQKPLHSQKTKTKPKWQNKNATKTTITQRLPTELGRSVGVTTITQLVWLNRFTESQSSH